MFFITNARILAIGHPASSAWRINIWYRSVIDVRALRKSWPARYEFCARLNGLSQNYSSPVIVRVTLIFHVYNATMDDRVLVLHVSTRFKPGFSRTTKIDVCISICNRKIDTKQFLPIHIKKCFSSYLKGEIDSVHQLEYKDLKGFKS